MDIKIAHSPDSDDAFMFYALTCGRIPTGSYKITHVLKDIESLNKAALECVYDISAISLHAYPFISKDYEILPSGASVGENYGPMVVSQNGYSLTDFIDKFSSPKNKLKIAIPGEKTTAFLVLKLLLPQFQHIALPFDEIIPACQRNEVDAGLIIHEGQLNYRECGMKKIVDLGSWWQKETGLPLPLGANVIRRNLGENHIQSLSKLIRQSIEFSLSDNHRGEALEYSHQFARGLDADQTDRFIRMYVNERTVCFDPDTLEAINLLYDRAAEKGLIPKQEKIKIPAFH